MRIILTSAVIAVAALVSACATMEGGVVIGEPPAEERSGHGAQGPPGVPPGHLPPPGECRIWYPGSPPGQQPPPGRCDDLARRVPPGAWLVYGGPKHGEYKIEEYDRERPGLVIVIRYYDVDTGTLIKVEKRF